MDTQPQEQSRLLRALSLLRPCWKTVAWALALILIVSGLNAVEPMIQRVLIDALTAHQNHLPGSMGIGKVILIVIAAMAVLTIVRGAFNGISTYLTMKLRLRSNLELDDMAVRRIYNQSISYHRNARIGELMSNLSQSVNGYSSVLNDVMLNVLPNIVFLLCTFFFMLMMDVRLTMIAAIFAPLPAIISVTAGRISAARERKMVKRWAEIFARLHEGLALVKTMKSFGLEQTEHNRFMEQLGSANQVVLDGTAVDSMFAFVKNRITDAARLSVLGYGAYLVSQGQISIGTLVAFLSFTNNLFGPMLGLMSVYETIKKAQVYLDTIFDIIDSPLGVPDRPDAMDIPHIDGAIEFDQVSFGYVPDQPVLKSVSFKANPASMVALVGTSGSGKTTIIDLINRFYDAEDGRILFDGVDIRDIKGTSVRSHIGMVLQDTALFNDSIRNNIACSRPDATDEEIRAAAKAAAADAFIMRKQNRYDTMVGEAGGQLSAGERQRIAIARAILKNPQIYVFDEASSNLDAESEEVVSQVIVELAKTKTVFVIAHRLGSIRNADQILVLNEGVVCEQGTHEELMEHKGHYAHLVMAQTDQVCCNDVAAVSAE